MFILQSGDTKQFLSIDRQLKQLSDRGLIIEDPDFAKAALKELNYYRLSGYSLTIRKHPDGEPDKLLDDFLDGTTFADLFGLYCFDMGLREVVMTYSSKAEISLRAIIAHRHAEIYGPLGYMEPSYFFDPDGHRVFIRKLEDKIDESKERFVVYHKNKLGGIFPFWVAVEVSDFGMLSKFYDNMQINSMLPSGNDTNVPKMISREYAGMPDNFVFASWMHCAVVMRNIAAHGGRFYNRVITSAPQIEKALKREPNKLFDRNSTFAGLYAISRLLPNDADRHDFVLKLRELIGQYDMVNLNEIGFPQEWEAVLMKQ